MLLRMDRSGRKGSCGPYIQSQRLAIYRPYVTSYHGGSGHPVSIHETLRVMREEQIALKQHPATIVGVYDCLQMMCRSSTARGAACCASEDPWEPARLSMVFVGDCVSK